MRFYKIPTMYASVGTGRSATFGFQLDEPGDIDLRIRDTGSDRLLGGRRFVNVSQAEIDVAPRIRSAISFAPSTGLTGFKTSDDRVIMAGIEALRPGSETIELSSGARRFLLGDQPLNSSRLLTAMPMNRLIPAGASDEISIYHNRYCSFVVTATSRGTTVAEQYDSPQYGLQVFRLNTSDFPDCDTITVDTGVCGSIVYTVVPASQQAVRLAWLSHAGSIEHYSFPTLRETTLRIDKQRAEGVDGDLLTAAETLSEKTLVSALESPEMLETVAELTSARNVWVAGQNSYTPIDVLTDEAVIQRYGSLCALELVVRSKTAASWS